MYFKNVKAKLKFIDNLCDDDNQSIKSKLPILWHLSRDKNPDVRENLASQLVFFDLDEIEDILYEMLYDKNRRVRLEAVDSLSVGRQPRSIEKVKSMLVGEGCLIRAYAVITLFSLITNCYGMNTYAFEKYEQMVNQSYGIEKNPRVLLEYYRNQFFIDSEEGLALLEKIYRKAVDDKDYELIWPLLHTFQEIKNVENAKRVQQVFAYNVESLLPEQQKLMTKIVANDIPCRILLADKDDTYLTHLVFCVLNSMNISNIEISTAGFETGNVRKKEISAFCKQQCIEMDEEFYSKKITDAFLYDYIVFLNSRSEKEKFSLCRTICYDEVMEDDLNQIVDVCQNICQIIRK